MKDFGARVAEVRTRIEAACRRAGRSARDVRLVGVTKSLPRELLREVAGLGLHDVGENRALEGLARRRILDAPLRWHMIGRLQTNKVKTVLEWADVLHSVDRWDLVEELESQLLRRDRKLSCYVQVNVSGEASKAGISPNEVETVIPAIRARAPHLDVLGLMTMAPEGADPRGHFRMLRELAARCRLPGLSMGMTQDFECAIEEGATCVRVGSALFGEPTQDFDRGGVGGVV